MRGLEFVLILMLGAALVLVGRDDLHQRDQLTIAGLALTAQTGARGGETAAAGRAQADCTREVATALRAGRTISRLSAPVSPQEAATRPMLSAEDLASVAAP